MRQNINFSEQSRSITVLFLNPHIDIRYFDNCAIRFKNLYLLLIWPKTSQELQSCPKWAKKGLIERKAWLVFLKLIVSVEWEKTKNATNLFRFLQRPFGKQIIFCSSKKDILCLKKYTSTCSGRRRLAQFVGEREGSREVSGSRKAQLLPEINFLHSFQNNGRNYFWTNVTKCHFIKLVN